MHPVLAKELPKAHCKAITRLVIRIDFDAKSIRDGQNETISCEFHWVCAVAGEAPLSDCTIIDFECGIAMPDAMIFFFL